MPRFKKGEQWDGNAAQLWKKGQSGNPKGRAANKSITTWVKELLASEEVEVNITRWWTTDSGQRKKKKEHITLSSNDSKTMNAVIAARLVHAAADGNLDFIREVLNRVEGKPREVVEIDENKPKERPPQIIFSVQNFVDEQQIQEHSKP